VDASADWLETSAASSARTGASPELTPSNAWRALEAEEVSSQSALDSTRPGYQVGRRSNLDVLNAQQQLYSTRRDLARARYDAIVNSLRLKSAAGILKEDDLMQVNGLLQR